MSVTERLMEPGSWDLRLVDETPASLINVVDNIDEYLFAHVVITPVHVPLPVTVPSLDVGQQWHGAFTSDDFILPMAKYTGRINQVLDGGKGFEGAGLAVWLGDEDRKGPVYETFIEHTNANLTTWVNSLLQPGSLPIFPENTVEPDGVDPLTWEVIYQTPRQALEMVCRYFGVEWRIKPNATINVGPKESLFVTDPKVVITRQPGGSEPLNVQGIATHSMGIDYDTENYVSRIVELTRTGLGFDVAVGEADKDEVPYKDFFGNPVNITKVIDAYEFLGEEIANHLADQEILEHNVETRIDLDADAYAIHRHAEVGDTVLVYDPLRGVVDRSNTFFYRGELIFPVKLRIYAYTWPIERGMGVYIRRYKGDDVIWTDVTHWVEWEESTTSAEADQHRTVKPPTIEELYPDLF